MKKSLLITFDFPPVRGGISHMLWEICRRFPIGKIVVLTQPSKTVLKSKFVIYRKRMIAGLKFIWPKWISLLWQIRQILKKEEINIIQAGQILPIGTVAWLYKKIFNVPYLVYIYGQDLVFMRHRRRKIKLIRTILKNADFVVTCSYYTKKLAVNFGAVDQKTIVSYPCPQMNKIEAVDPIKLREFKNKYGLDNKKIILTVGNLVDRKGQDMTLKALPKVLTIIPDTIYAVVGQGPSKNKLKDLSVQLEIDNQVKFFDNISNQELTMFYQACDVFIMASRELKNEQGQVSDVEGFGMVFLEANLYNKPVIGGRSGGVPEAVEHGLSGLLVDPEDKNDIANSLIKLLSDKDYADKLGRQGRERAVKKFITDVEINKIKELLK